jgi:hypothetical protein
MSDDDMVTLEVRMTEKEVRNWAKSPHRLATAAREWVAAHDKPERRVLLFTTADGEYAYAVAAEDLEPGDRVAGREVHEAGWSSATGIDVSWVGERVVDYYPPGTLVVLDPDDAA